MKIVQNEKYKVRLGIPGKVFDFGSVIGLVHATRSGHSVTISNFSRGWTDFEEIWADALNAFEAEEVTHFAMLHADVAPQIGWVDTLIQELEHREADIVSSIVPIKDSRGLTSSGIGDPEDRWNPFRRFTMREVMKFPETFSAEEIGYSDKFLLHNTGCWLCDLRKPLFSAADANGELIAHFDFPKKIIRDSAGKWIPAWESEDWFFSRKLHELQAKTCITRKVKLTHRGPVDFPNSEPWGAFENGDDNTRYKWNKDKPVDFQTVVREACQTE